MNANESTEKEKSSIYPEEECPKFNRCSVNRCPLSKDYSKLITMWMETASDGKLVPFTGDPETKCKASIKVREKIAFNYPQLLPNFGLTDDELIRKRQGLAARLKWDSLPEEEKAARIARLAEARKTSPRGSGKKQ